MYRPSNKQKQLDLFASIPGMLKGSAYDQFINEQAWHNMFREHVVNRIDENLFKSLFSDRMGAPNASIKVLIGMMSLKEGFGWSDSELFEHCRFDLLTRSSLGLFNINDNIPAESTYYLFRRKLHEYHRENNVDLIEKVFGQITSDQVQTFNVNGRSIRMDSKLIGSNIAWCTRYELIHNTLSLFYNALTKKNKSRLTVEIRSQLDDLASETGTKVVYKSNKEEINQRMINLGGLCFHVLALYTRDDNKHYMTLKRVFEEQYRIDEGGITKLRATNDIPAASTQSPFDTDCTFRKKEGSTVKGYSVNVTETCDDDTLNLITDVQISKASKPDVDYLIPAVEQSSQVLGHSPEDLHADGAYQNPSNISYCSVKEISYYFTSMQAAISRYNLDLNGGELTITDNKTGEIMPVKKLSAGKWGIKSETGYRYFTQKQIDTYLLRKRIEQMPIEKRRKRNNVEATIFQLCYHSRNNKTRYRGLFQHRSWALLRCVWINLRRIVSFVEQICQRTCLSSLKLSKKMLFISNLSLEAIINSFFNLYHSYFQIFRFLHFKLAF
jgi:hypothetical protein